MIMTVALATRPAADTAATRVDSTGFVRRGGRCRVFRHAVKAAST
jgi:hypothetical protein